MQIKLLHKPGKYPINHGYDMRQNAPQSFTIIVHSTNGNIGSTFAAEENYLLAAANVSTHFLISKNGTVTQYFDDITKYRAWHAGAVINPIYNNNNSIGIECHYTPGESMYQPAMIRALTELLEYLVTTYTITDIAMHRSVAVFESGPKKGQLGRKVDPSFLTDVDFYMLKSRVMTPQNTNKVLILGHNNANIDVLRDKLARRGVALDSIVPIVTAYTVYGELTTMGNVYPLAQAAKETGWFQSPRWIKSFNPAGIGATNDGAWGNHFNNVAEGVLAQYAHLLTYATKPDQNTFIIEQIARLSPRHDIVVSKGWRGIAQYWQDLSGKWNFPSLSYHEKILEIAAYLQG